MRRGLGQDEKSHTTDSFIILEDIRQLSVGPATELLIGQFIPNYVTFAVSEWFVIAWHYG